MAPANVIVIMTDELRRDCVGAYGNPLIKTPHLDALAARGVRYDAAYTPSPICVPARAAIATGRYVHEIGCWGNAQPYAGTPESWHHRVRAAGRDMLSIGKLHFRSTADDNGFSDEIHPLHVKDGRGWVHGLLRDREDLFDASGFAAHIGLGEDPYTAYDEVVCAATVDWIARRGKAEGQAPWCLYVSFLRPHYPLTCPPRFYNLYDPAEVPTPRLATAGSGADHPVLAGLRRACNYDAPFDDETRQIAVASYYGLCSFVDDLVGRILGALTNSGQADDTAIIFTSDHGECLGDRGFWTKMVMYEEAAAVPLIMAGPGIEPAVCTAPVSLIDLYPTMLDLTGAPPRDPPPHARSLLASAKAPDPDRAVLSEYHDYSAATGMFLLRRGRWKLVVYPGFASHLFDLEADPGETRDLGGDPAYAKVIADLMAALNAIADPDAVNAQAFADQARRIDELGGRDAILAMPNYDHTPVEAPSSER
ncbi:MAG: sulfatase-like hydrolase/transferase [Pseudomonadota bacterium]